MFPIKFVLILQTNFRAVLRMDIIPIANALRLKFSIHQFTGVVTDSIIQSFNANSSNDEFFKALPLEKIFENDISQTEAEKLYINLKYFLDQNPTPDKLYQIQLSSATLYLSSYDIFSINNFVYQFVANYETLKLNIAVIQSNQIKNDNIQIQESQQAAQNSIPTPTPIIQEDEERIEIIEDNQNVDSLILLNDILKLSPNRTCNYFISKNISNIINSGKVEKVDIEDRNNNVFITLTPLLDYQTCLISNFHNNLLNIINSFTFTNDEYISKLKSLVRVLIYMIGRNDFYSFFIHLKVIGFLVYVYSNKLSTGNLANQINLNGKIKVSSFFDSMNYMINYSIDYTFKNFINKDNFRFNSIVLQHEKIPKYLEQDIPVEELKQVIRKELYLVDIDKDYFINRVFSIINQDKSKSKEDKSCQLILNNPNTLDINFLLEQPKTESMISYGLVQTDQKQFEQNKIISPEYFQILQLINTPTISKSMLKNINPIITKYSDTIINVIFKELSMADSSTVTSLLNVLNSYIRPYLNSTSSIETELFILYRLVVPYLYDIYGMTNFIDYFH